MNGNHIISKHHRQQILSSVLWWYDHTYLKTPQTTNIVINCTVRGNHIISKHHRQQILSSVVLWIGNQSRQQILSSIVLWVGNHIISKHHRQQILSSVVLWIGNHIITYHSTTDDNICCLWCFEMIWLPISQYNRWQYLLSVVFWDDMITYQNTQTTNIVISCTVNR